MSDGPWEPDSSCDSSTRQGDARQLATRGAADDAAFHQFVAGLLAERLKHVNDTLRVLLD